MQALELLSIFIDPLEKNEISYFVTGSVASIFYGEPRLTHDVDIVVQGSLSELEKLPALFPEEQFYCPPKEVLAVESKRQPYGHCNLLHHSSGWKADLYLNSDNELHQWGDKHKKRVQLSENLRVWLAPPEYIIIRKLEFFREGNSQKHIEDLKKMLPQVQEQLDMKFLMAELDSRQLKQIWDQCI